MNENNTLSIAGQVQRVSPAMRVAASNWNEYAKQFARRFQRIQSKIKAGQVTEEDLRNQYRKNNSNPIQSIGFTNSHNRS